MKGLLGWVKGHLVIVVLVVLMLSMLPTAYFISAKLDRGIAERQSNAYNDEKQKITRAARVTYALPRISSKESPDALSEVRAPNDRVSNWYAEQIRLRTEQVEQVKRAAVSLNRGEHTVLVEGFPPPASADNRAKMRAILDLGRALTGVPGRQRPALEVLFEQVGAGMPPSREDVAEEIGEFYEREWAMLVDKSQGGRVLPADEEALNELLVERRIGMYRRRAEELSLYGSADVLYGGGSGGSALGGGRGGSAAAAGTIIPREFPSNNPPSLSEVYLWQWDYWVVEDLLRAVRRANSDVTGDPTPIPVSVVKRIESITIEPFALPEVDDEVGGTAGLGGSMAAMGGSSRRSSDSPEKVTLTKRKSGDGPYDLRRATMTVVVSSSRLPTFLSAIRTTNLMTVTDLDIEEVDVWGDLSEGYYYGDEHVVRATIGIESVWLREWTKQFMPEPVRRALGVQMDSAGGEGSDG